MLSSKIQSIVDGILIVKGDSVELGQEDKLASELMDKLVWEAVFGKGEDRAQARWLIWEAAQLVGVLPASINDLYMARGRNELSHDFTVPAINIRGMAYDMGRAIFGTAKNMKVGALICEIARSEMGYTDQPPEEYAVVTMAAALREGWRGALFLQGDHFQAKEAGPGTPKDGEVEAIRKIIDDAVKAGFYNIDIDMSTLVDLNKPTEDEQQEANIKYSLEFTKYIRSLEPKGVTISLGGEIGHIGGKNSTVEDFEAYIKGFNAGLDGMVGMSKISIQTGTSHGGVVMPDGTLADVDVDFGVLNKISKACFDKYDIGGAVQHGASTLPDEFFAQFPKSEALEVHLATGFQNIIMDHPSFPKDLLSKMYKWLDAEKSDERKEGQTDDQFHYKLRKKAWGQFKRECWSIDVGAREKIRAALAERFKFMFTELNVGNTMKMVADVVKAVRMSKSLAEFGGSGKVADVKGLSD